MYVHKPHASHCLFLIDDNLVTYTHNFSRFPFIYFSEQEIDEKKEETNSKVFFHIKCCLPMLEANYTETMHNSYLFSSNCLLFGSSTNHFDMNFLEFLNTYNVSYVSKTVANSSIWLYVNFDHISNALNLRYDPFT